MRQDICLETINVVNDLMDISLKQVDNMNIQTDGEMDEWKDE